MNVTDYRQTRKKKLQIPLKSFSKVDWGSTDASMDNECDHFLYQKNDFPDLEIFDFDLHGVTSRKKTFPDIISENFQK